MFSIASLLFGLAIVMIPLIYGELVFPGSSIFFLLLIEIVCVTASYYPFVCWEIGISCVCFTRCRPTIDHVEYVEAAYNLVIQTRCRGWVLCFLKVKYNFIDIATVIYFESFLCY